LLTEASGYWKTITPRPITVETPRTSSIMHKKYRRSLLRGYHSLLMKSLFEEKPWQISSSGSITPRCSYMGNLAQNSILLLICFDILYFQLRISDSASKGDGRYLLSEISESDPSGAKKMEEWFLATQKMQA